MIALLLALALQAESPSPSPTAAPTQTPRPAPTARPLPKPTPPYLISPKGWTPIKYRHDLAGRLIIPVAGWSRFTDLRGNEELAVHTTYSNGLTAQEFADIDVQFDTGGEFPRLIANHARALCGGTVPGWEVVSRQGTGIGTRTSDRIYAVDATHGYVVQYGWESDFPPAPEAVAALRSFCPTHERVTTGVIRRAAIDPPHGWAASDVSMSYGLKAGTAMLYIGPFTREAREQILVYRMDSPQGMSADVDADIAFAVEGTVQKNPHTMLSKTGIELCNGDAWLVVVDVRFPHEHAIDTAVFSFGAPYTYLVTYRRTSTLPASPQAMGAIKSLCPPKL